MFKKRYYIVLLIIIVLIGVFFYLSREVIYKDASVTVTDEKALPSNEKILAKQPFVSPSKPLLLKDYPEIVKKVTKDKNTITNNDTIGAIKQPNGDLLAFATNQILFVFKEDKSIFKQVNLPEIPTSGILYNWVGKNLYIGYQTSNDSNGINVFRYVYDTEKDELKTIQSLDPSFYEVEIDHVSPLQDLVVFSKCESRNFDDGGKCNTWAIYVSNLSVIKKVLEIQVSYYNVGFTQDKIYIARPIETDPYNPSISSDNIYDNDNIYIIDANKIDWSK
jgi:hypothetical protein